MKVLAALFRRKRYVVMLVSAILLPALAKVGLDESAQQIILKLVLGWMGAQTVSDFALAWRGTKKE